jgi:hypothetical protein
VLGTNSLGIQHLIKKEIVKTSMSNNEIKDIVAALKGLKLQEKKLLERLEILSEAGSHTIGPREFALGDQVRIENPNRHQARSGRIIKIGERITVQAKNGSKIIRAPSNLTHLN